MTIATTESRSVLPEAIGSIPLTSAPDAALLFPTLTSAQIARIASHGVTRPVVSGELLIEGGQTDVPFFVLKAGGVEVVRPSGLGDVLEEVLTEWATSLSVGLVNLIHVLNPDSIVVGGPLAVLYPRIAERYFESPADGRVRIAVFFVGFGKGTGTAWFDDLKLEEVDPSAVSVKITKEPLTKQPLNRYQYGQFVEYLCDLIPSMWAEKLYDGSFEGLTPYKVAYLRETDNKERPWYPSGATNRAEFSLDKANPVSGNASKRIAVKGEAP